MRGKIILIEGTDCSGKETQSKLIVENLNKMNTKAEYFSFPNYDSPTGKIVGGPFLGKTSICKGFFKEGSSNVDGKVASLYYAADRLYNNHIIEEKLSDGINIILDRYVYSNMAYQASKFKNLEQRREMYSWIEELEFDFLKLREPDVTIFLHTPVEKIQELFKKRTEEADQNEENIQYLKQAEMTYYELSQMYKFKIIECCNDMKMRTIEDINLELMEYIEDVLCKTKNIFK